MSYGNFLIHIILHEFYVFGEKEPMRKIFVARYLYKKRFYYLFTIYVYVAAYFCGIFTASKVNTENIFDISVFSEIFSRFLPVFAMCVAGLFFVGNLFVLSGLCFSAYRLGYVLGESFALSLQSGMTYIFFVGLPIGTLFFLCDVFCAANAFECNISRFQIRKKGLARPMNDYEMHNYISKCIIALGCAVLGCILEYKVFMLAYINIMF